MNRDIILNLIEGGVQDLIFLEGIIRGRLEEEAKVKWRVVSDLTGALTIKEGDVTEYSDAREELEEIGEALYGLSKRKSHYNISIAVTRMRRQI
jgi:hypothetical protein